MRRYQLSTTSCAEIGEPSLKVAPARIVKSTCRPSSLTVQLDASAGLDHIVRIEHGQAVEYLRDDGGAAGIANLGGIPIQGRRTQHAQVDVRLAKRRLGRIGAKRADQDGRHCHSQNQGSGRHWGSGGTRSAGSRGWSGVWVRRRKYAP
jgi:hypothetical protein